MPKPIHGFSPNFQDICTPRGYKDIELIMFGGGGGYLATIVAIVTLFLGTLVRGCSATLWCHLDLTLPK